LKLFLQEGALELNPIIGAGITIRKFGDFLGLNAHCDVMVKEGISM
jgi:hypothetical protein